MMNEILKRIQRNFLNEKNYNVINIAGLAIGIVCVFVIMLWVEDELKFDTFNKNANKIYRVIAEEEGWSGHANSAITMRPLVNALKEKLPEVEKAASFEMDWDITANVGENAYSEKGLAVISDDFFEMFSFPFVKGDPNTLFSDKYSVVVSERIAKKYFGYEEPIGKHLKINKRDVTVVAVFKTIDYNSHIRFDMAISTKLGYDIFDISGQQWGNWCLYTYIQTVERTNPQQLSSKLYSFLADYVDKENEEHLLLQPLKEIHFGKELADEDYSYLGDKQYVYIFSFLAVLILILACINYINLSTAVSGKKIKENGIRKILGATKLQLIRASLTKSVLISVVSTGIAIVILYLVIPLFNNLTQKNFSIDFTNPLYVFTILLIPLITGLASGIYPAIHIASFSPSNIKKNSITANSWQRKGLIILQFTFSIGLIIATLISFKQVQFIRQKDLGFDKEHIIHFYLDVNESGYKATKERLLKIPGVEMVAGKNDFSPTVMCMSQVLWRGINEAEIFVQNGIDEDFFPLLKVNFIEGNDFSKATDKQQGVIINKKAKEMIGNDNPIGLKLTIWDRQFRVIGVIDNAHFWTLSEDIHPEFYVYTQNTQNFFVRFRNSSNIPVQQIIGQIQATVKEMHPSLPFDFKFMDDTYARLYENDQRVGTIFSIMAVVAILISCMGLFGLSIFSSEKRTKEIGIRKVNGAKVSEIMTLLNKDFVNWVVIAFAIATPVAYYAMNKWLENFAYKTSLSWWIFALAGFLAFGIASLTVSWQSWKAATRNPVEALRYE
jgi:putative ABC transport system permease protein